MLPRAQLLCGIAASAAIALSAIGCSRGDTPSGPTPTPFAPSHAPTSMENRFEPEIRAFEKGDRLMPPPSDGILFTGGSSVRFWTTIARDFPGYPVINRGFGGARLVDSVFYADRIVLTYHPRVVFLYAGVNDLAEGKPPSEITADFRKFVATIHEKQPAVKIAFISCAPTISRLSILNEIRQLNHEVEEITRTDPRLFYVDIASPMLGSDGVPKKDLLIEDGLHLSPQGYAVWTAVLRPWVAKLYGSVPPVGAAVSQDPPFPR